MDQAINETAAVAEAEVFMKLAAKELGTPTDDLSNARRTRFTREQNVFLPNTIAVANLEDPSLANATLPLFMGTEPLGEPTYFIVTEAANFFKWSLAAVMLVAKRLRLKADASNLKWDVDFNPERRVTAGDGPFAFPPSVAEPGSVGDAEYSSLVVLPGGSVINAQIVANNTGVHDRIVNIDTEGRTVMLELLDGFRGGNQFYYHLVTDAIAVPVAIENGNFAPRMADLPAFGESSVFDQSTFLGLSPVVNGETGVDNPEQQSLSSTIVDDDLDSINVFPFDPDNDQQFFNNYSPMWDAHLNMWTQEAIDAGLRRCIVSFEDLTELVEAGHVTSFEGSPGESNALS